MNKQYRYSNYVDGRLISECDWLLQASNSKGQIFDNLRQKFIEPHPYSFLLTDAFSTKMSSGQRLSEVLAITEYSGVIEVFLEETNTLYQLCINPEVKVIFNVKRRIEQC